MPSSDLLTIASSDESTMAASRARASSARLRSVTSRKTSTAPTMAPAASRMGAALSSIGRSVPSLAIRTVWFASPTTVPSSKARRAGFSTGWRVPSLTMRKTSEQRAPHGLCLGPAGQKLGHAVQERHLALGVGADHGVADAGERDPQPFRLLLQRLLGALASEEDAAGVLQGNGTEQLVLVVFCRHQPPPIAFRRECGAEDAGPDLLKRRVAARGRVVAERREPAIVRRAQLLDRNVCGRFQDSVPNLFRRLDARVDRRDDADEDPLVGLQVLADDLQDAVAVLFARQGDVEIPRLQLEQARQQLGVIDVPAVGRVAVAARAGVHADALAILGREPRQRKVVQVDEAVEQTAGRIDLDRQPALREVDLDLVRALLQAAADLGLVLVQQVVDELLAGVTGDLRRPGT